MGSVINLNRYRKEKQAPSASAAPTRSACASAFRRASGTRMPPSARWKRGVSTAHRRDDRASERDE